MKSITLTHKGKRKVNQDVILTRNINPDTYLYLVADGMGGYDNGEVSAQIATESILTFLSNIDEITKETIQKAINKANLAIRQYQEQHHSKMGTTLGAIVLSKGVAKCFWVGDVKIMLFRNDKIIFESRSHNFINDMIDNGSINNPKNLSNYAHIVTRSIQGNIDKSKISYKELNLLKGDIIILCSDGVHNLIDCHSIQHIFSQESNLDQKIENINQRLEVEANDNSSLIAIQL